MDRSIRQDTQGDALLRCVQWVGLLSTLFAPVSVAHAQDTLPLLVRAEDRTRLSDRNRVVVRDPRTGLDREIYRSEGHIPYEVTLSSDGRYVAFLEVRGPAGNPMHRLVVVDVSDRVVRFFGETPFYGASGLSIRGIREFTWCCGPNKLATLAGRLGEPAPIDETRSLPSGVSVIDVPTGTEVRIEGVRLPQQIHWAAFDSSLYIKDAPPPEARGKPGVRTWPVYRYHVPSARLSLTTHLGVYFSPDGKYYFDTGVYEASRSFTLYQTANDQDLTAQLALPRHHLGPEGGWLPGADHVLIFVEKPAPQAPRAQQTDRSFAATPTRTPQVYPDRWNLLVDAETGRVINRFQGDIRAGWKTNVRALPVERRTGVELVPPRRP